MSSALQVVGRPEQVDLGADLSVPVDDALGRPRGPGGEHHRTVRVGAGRRRRRGAAAAAGQLVQVVADAEQPTGRGGQRVHGDPRARQPHGACGGQASRPGDEMVDGGAAQGATHPGEAEALVGDDDDGARSPDGVHHRGQVGRRLDQQADPVPGPHPGGGQTRRRAR